MVCLHRESELTLERTKRRHSRNRTQKKGKDDAPAFLKGKVLLFHPNRCHILNHLFGAFHVSLPSSKRSWNAFTIDSQAKEEQWLSLRFCISFSRAAFPTEIAAFLSHYFGKIGLGLQANLTAPAVLRTVAAGPRDLDNVLTQQHAVTAAPRDLDNVLTQQRAVTAAPRDLDKVMTQQKALKPEVKKEDMGYVVDATIRPLPKLQTKLSVLVLVFKEYKSLTNSLRSWDTGGLFDYADEVILLLNGESRAPESLGIPFLDRMKVLTTNKNLIIGEAMLKLVNAAKNEVVLFLEKDFHQVEPRDVLERRLDDGYRMVSSGQVEIVRYRHREKPGFPMYAQIMGENREHLMFGVQSNLWCFVIHWVADPVAAYPEKFSWCNFTLSEQHVCSKPNWCQWTNNPQMYRKQWFLKEMGEVYLKHGLPSEPSSHMRDFEFFSYWNPHLKWNERNDWTVALGGGLFTHGEMEGHITGEMKFYGQLRRKTDIEDMRRELVQADKKLRLMDQEELTEYFKDKKNGYVGFLERFPSICWKYLGGIGYTFEQQVAMIEQFDKDDRNGYAAFEKQQRWDQWKLYLGAAGERTKQMLANGSPPHPGTATITWITGIFDLGRGDLHAQGGFKRDFSMYLDALKHFISYDGYKMVIFTEQWIIDEITPSLDEETKLRIHWIAMTLEELKARLPYDSFATIDKIRTNPKWYGQAGWLAQSPQAKLPLYNPLVMAKVFLIADAARLDPFHTTHFLWIDVKHNCLSDQFKPNVDWIVRAHMIDQYLLTYFKYGPAHEVHGFEGKAFSSMIGVTNRERVKVVRGGILGAARALCIAVELLYKIALRGSLKLGYMGTEENVLSLIMYNVPEVFAPFSNDDACDRQPEGDHACVGASNPHGNCAIFDWVYKGGTSFRPDPDAHHPDGVAPHWAKHHGLLEEVCIFQDNNWLVIFNQEKCEAKGGGWHSQRQYDRGYFGMGECTSKDGSVSWNARTSCGCYPAPCDAQQRPGDCYHEIPCCVDRKCLWLPSAKNRKCATGKCNGKGQCCDKSGTCVGTKLELPEST
eukprot:g82616.t1